MPGSSTVTSSRCSRPAAYHATSTGFVASVTVRRPRSRSGSAGGRVADPGQPGDHDDGRSHAGADRAPATPALRAGLGDDVVVAAEPAPRSTRSPCGRPARPAAPTSARSASRSAARSTPDSARETRLFTVPTGTSSTSATWASDSSATNAQHQHLAVLGRRACASSVLERLPQQHQVGRLLGGDGLRRCAGRLLARHAAAALVPAVEHGAVDVGVDVVGLADPVPRQRSSGPARSGRRPRPRPRAAEQHERAHQERPARREVGGEVGVVPGHGHILLAGPPTRPRRRFRGQACSDIGP